MRDLRTGIVSRHLDDGTEFHIGTNPTAEEKAAGDESLKGVGYVLVEAPRGCIIEES